MNESPTYTPDDQVLAKFLLEVEVRGPERIDIDEWIRERPHMAERFREALRMISVLDASTSETGPHLPQRLGHFRVLRIIAIGGMGIVYEALDERLERHVAVKTIRGRHFSGNLKDRFLREQQILARLHQTHIVPIYSAGEVDDVQYFAMPYIQGAPLGDVIRLNQYLRNASPSARTPSLGELARLAKTTVENCDAETVTEVDGHPLRTSPFHKQPPVQRCLSVDYLRSVARLMSDVADAIHHAHSVSILHRDIKPSNLMVDSTGQCWIIDFGLGAILAAATQGDRGDGKDASGSAPVVVSQPYGTPQYMAPEQFDGRADVRTDVWGLGTTLYELLTLQRAFPEPNADQLRRAIKDQPLVPPRSLMSGLPRELDAICGKALRKVPDDRYQTAKEFADDLRRWLHGEPTMAWPIRTPRRVWKWACRNKAWATTLALALLTAIILAFGAFQYQSARTEEALARSRADRRNLLLQELQRIRLGERTAGWSADAWLRAHEATTIRPDAVLRDHAAAILSDLDAVGHRRFNFVGSSVALSNDGSQFLCAPPQEEGFTRWWDGTQREPRLSRRTGTGVVAFADGKTPVQWMIDSPTSFLLWNVQESRIERQFDLPPADGDFVVDPSQRPQLAVTPDAKHAAALVFGAEGQARFVVWDVDAGDVTSQSLCGGNKICLAPDGSLLATGGDEGHVEVWSLDQGERLAQFRPGRNAVHCLCFGYDRHRHREPEGLTKGDRWHLAAGDAGGTVWVWRVPSNTLHAICRGSHYDVYAVAFSQDGRVLASGGRGRPCVWDVATGTRLLQLDALDFTSSIDVSADGALLAATSWQQNDQQSATRIWRLQDGRGIKTLQGLANQVSKIALNRSCTHVAALSHGWEVGVWELHSGQLQHVIEAPKGLVADNAALVLSPEAGKLAISTGNSADVWDLTSGTRESTWDLPPGLTDAATFSDSEQLLLLRTECVDGVTPPYSDAPPSSFPRVCRIRNLNSDTPLEPVAELTQFNVHVFTALADPQGRYFVISGLQNEAGQIRQVVTAVEAATGRSLWSVPSDADGVLSLSSTGSVLALRSKRAETYSLLEMPLGRHLGAMTLQPMLMHHGASLVATQGPRQPSGHHHGYSLYRFSGDQPLVTLGLDTPLLSFFGQLSHDGQVLAWGNIDGTVTACNLEEVRRQLAELNLDW